MEFHLHHAGKIFANKGCCYINISYFTSDLAASLTPHDWLIIEKSVDILKTFLDITNEISAERNISISKLIPLIKFLRKIYGLNEILRNEIRVMVDIFKQQFDTRFKYLEENELTTQATILDPRFKKYGFLDKDKYKIAEENLKKICSVKLSQEENEQHMPSTSTQTS